MDPTTSRYSLCDRLSTQHAEKGSGEQWNNAKPYPGPGAMEVLLDHGSAPYGYLAAPIMTAVGSIHHVFHNRLTPEPRQRPRIRQRRAAALGRVGHAVVTTHRDGAVTISDDGRGTD